MAPKKIVRVLAIAAVVFSTLSFVPSNLVRPVSFAFARDVARTGDGHSPCVPVGGALTTNIGAIAGVTNLGPVFGDLAGSVAATILGQNSETTGPTSAVGPASSTIPRATWIISGWRTFTRIHSCCAIAARSVTRTELRPALRTPSSGPGDGETPSYA
jgi:hypothetical protein